MGCSITIVRPEHKILDWCNEICRLASIAEDQTNCGSSIGSSRSGNQSIDSEITYCCNSISDIAKSCDILPQYCLREIRHAVETIHFKKPEVFERLSKLCDATILSIRRKTLGLQSQYSCLYSPNQGELKLDFSKLEDYVPSSPTASPRTPSARKSSISEAPSSPSRTRLMSGSSSIQAPAFPVPMLENMPQSPSKTPTTVTPASPRPPPMISMTPPATSLHKKIESKRRASCPTPSYEVNNRTRLKSLDENDDNVLVDYGFYHEDDTHMFDV